MKTSLEAEQLLKRILDAVDATPDPQGLHADLMLFCPKARIRLVTSPDVTTARICRFGGTLTIEFNKDFVEHDVKNDSDLLFVFLHECFHHVLGHLWLGSHGLVDEVRALAENIAADILVNKAVCERFFPEGVGLLTRLYAEPDPVNVLLKPPQPSRKSSKGDEFRRTLLEAGYPAEVARLAWNIYRAGWYGEVAFETLADMVENLLRMTEANAQSVLLLGYHGLNQRVAGPWPWGTPWIGYGEEIFETRTKEQVRSQKNRKLAMALYRAIENDYRAQHMSITYTPTTSPLFSPGRTDYHFLAMNMFPAIYHGLRIEQNVIEERAHVYVDVSGSFEGNVATVFGFLTALGDMVGRTIYQFSNRVVEVTMEDIRKGVVKTTEGTDFDCVLQHALARKFRRIVVITDGAAMVSPALANAFCRSGGAIYLVLFNNFFPFACPLEPYAREIINLV